MRESSACIDVSVLCEKTVCEGQKREWDSLELELTKVMNHVGAENQTAVVNRSQCS